MGATDGDADLVVAKTVNADKQTQPSYIKELMLNPISMKALIPHLTAISRAWFRQTSQCSLSDFVAVDGKI